MPSLAGLEESDCPACATGWHARCCHPDLAEDGELRASVGFDAGGHSNAHIQGPPAALRELAAALIQAADQAESDEDSANAVAVVEGVAG